MHISEMQWKIKKESFVSEIMAFELVGVNSAYCYRNTGHRQLIIIIIIINDLFQFGL